MHQLDVDKAHGEKAWQQLHKNSTSHIKQILDATSHKTAVVRSPTSHLQNHSNQTNKICRTLLEKYERVNKRILLRTSGYNLSKTALSGQDVVRRTCRMQWTIETNGEGESGKSVHETRHDDDDDNDDERKRGRGKLRRKGQSPC